MGPRHKQNRREMNMSKSDYNKIKNSKPHELLSMPAHLIIEFLKGQNDSVGEEVAKACYQELARR